MNFQRICVVGLGYIGLPTAATFAANGQQVLGVDINPDILAKLKRGELHIVEPGLLEVFQQAVNSGNLTFGKEPEPCDAFIIAVPTPFKDGKLADMRFVISAAESILPHLKRGNLVVLESTSPPLTTLNLLKPILERNGLTAGKDFFLAYSPERVLPGQILRELVENARVIGGVNQLSAEVGKSLYGKFVKGEIVITDATTAEMVKLMENTYRDISIAAANEFSRLADRFGVDVWEAIQIANRHPRIKILNPGPGVGGHCISVDPWFFVESAPDLTHLILSSRQVNDSQPAFVVDWIKRIFGDVKDKNILALGLSYKPDVDDFRESPAVEVVHLLHQQGAVITAYDPYVNGHVIKGVNLAEHLQEAVHRADAILILVGHKEFFQPELAGLIDSKIVFDTVNMTQSAGWQNSRATIHRLGNGKSE